MGLRKIVVVQFKFNEKYYFSEDTFEKCVARVLSLADAKIRLDEETLVVFPEHIGSFLILLGEKELVAQIDSLRVLLRKMVRDNYVSLLKTWIRSRKWIASLILRKSQIMLETYFRVFRSLSRNYKTNIVAGSVLTPNVVIRGNKFILRGSELHNTCFVFNARGIVEGIQAKRTLGEIDKLLEATPSKDLRVIHTRLGSLGIALGEDCFQEDYIVELKRRGASILVNPALSCHQWNRKFEEKWRKGCWHYVQRLKMRYGLCSMGVGQIMDLVFEGMSSIIVPLEETFDGTGYLARSSSFKEEDIVCVKIS